MKRLMMMTLLVITSQPLWAGCESTYKEGGHTALTIAEAKKGAWEDASEACYPGKAKRISLDCTPVEGEIGVKGKQAIRCIQEVSCTLCGEALERKYDALNRK